MVVLPNYAVRRSSVGIVEHQGFANPLVSRAVRG
jgi:hypothetical protein